MKELMSIVRDAETKETFSIVSIAKPGSYMTKVYHHEDYLKDGDKATPLAYYSVRNEQALADLHTTVCKSHGVILKSTICEKE